LTLILQCSAATWGSWTRMSQFSFLPKRHESLTSGNTLPSAPDRLITTTEPWNGIFFFFFFFLMGASRATSAFLLFLFFVFFFFASFPNCSGSEIRASVWFALCRALSSPIRSDRQIVFSLKVQSFSQLKKKSFFFSFFIIFGYFLAKDKVLKTHHLSTLFPSGRCYSCLASRTTLVGRRRFCSTAVVQFLGR
jgi:hypothetical protein